MKLIKLIAAVSLMGWTFAACEVFEDQTPETISFRMDGPAGSPVTIVYSKQFVAGVNELGVTRVEIFRADTVEHILPIDTLIDVRLERRMYIRAETIPPDTLDVGVRVDVNERGIFDRTGKLFPTVPWQFLYQFNTRFTDDIQIVI